MSQKPLQPPEQDKQAKPPSTQPLTKYKQIALYLATILLASQPDLGIIADILSILVNLGHLRQILIALRTDHATPH